MLLLWNGRFRVIERPGQTATINKIEPPTSFGDHRWVAQKNWGIEKTLIRKMNQHVRGRETDFAPGKAKDMKVREFERRFRGTELMLDGIPLLTKFWLIHSQIRIGLKT